MKYTIKYDGFEDFQVITETGAIADIEEAHKKIEDEIKWLLITKDEIEPYEP